MLQLSLAECATFTFFIGAKGRLSKVIDTGLVRSFDPGNGVKGPD
jgi:hypothetical protein